MNATHALGWALLHFLWQGTLIALLARLLLGLLPARSGALRYSVAVGALALMPLAVAWSVSRGLAAPAAAEVAAWQPGIEDHRAAAPAPEHAAPGASLAALPAADPAREPAAGAGALPGARAWKERVDGMLPWIVGAWALGVLALAARLLASYSATRRLLRARREPVPEWVTATLGRLSRRLGLGRTVRVCQSRLTRVPAVAGWLEPLVLLPASTLTGLSPAELEAVLAHELAHVKRHDYLVNLFQSLVETLLFYHPAVWWLGARIRAEREHCCDDLAVAACGSAPLYAEALLSMERLRAPELALALTGGSLLERIERLLAPRERPREIFPRWSAGVSAAAVVLLFAATSDLAGAAPERREQREPARAQTGAGAVHLHPDPAQAFPRRNEWAEKEAAARGYRRFWIGHAIAPNPAFTGGIVMGRFEGSGGVVLVDGHDRITLTGRMTATQDLGSLQLPGTPLAPLVGADPADVGILYLCSGRGRLQVERVHLATAALAVDLEGLPLLWLGRAGDGESVSHALARMQQAEGAGARRDFAGVVGAHATSALVVPELQRMLAAGGRDDELRAEAAEWLAYHPVAEALAALEAAARGDRSEKVRAEAAEAVGEMRYGPAFDVLVALTRELTDRRARMEAIEGLGERTEPGAVPALLDLVEGDADEDVRREAIETLGDVPGRAGLEALAVIARANPIQELRREAIETYGECARPEDALAFLQDVVQRDPASAVRQEAVETIGELHHERAVDVLSRIVEVHEDPLVQREAVETLGETILGAGVAPILERIARTHPDVDVQREAVETLGDLHEDGNRIRDVVAALAADHPTPAVRVEAVETLEDVLPVDTAAALYERLLRAERSPLVREALEEALEELRGSRR